MPDQDHHVVTRDALRVQTPDGEATPSLDLLFALHALTDPNVAFEGDEDDARRFAPRIAEALLRVEPTPPTWVLESAARYGDAQTAHALGDWGMSTTDASLPEPMAGAAVQALARIGGPVALMQLQRLANDAQASMLASKAADCLQSLAEEHGLRVWELEDTSIPRCGLEDDRALPFSYGTRAFGLRLDPWLKPQIFDPSTRRLLEVPPEASPGDDLEAVAASLAKFDHVRADVEDMLPVQTRRLEAALAEQFRWNAGRWRQNMLGHPVMRLLIQRLVWGTYSKAGRCSGTFRVSEEFELTDAADNPFELTDEVFVGVVHPLDVEAEVFAAWSQLFSDYEIITLCPQFDRVTFRPPEALRKEEHFPLELEVDVEWGLRFLLGRRWRKEHGRWYGWEPIRRVFRTADIRAQINSTFQEDTLQLHGVAFERFLAHPQTNFQLRDVPKVVFSETVREFEEMREAWRQSR